MDPTDVVAAEHLAGLYRDRLRDATRAEDVLDALLDAKPSAVEVRLARHRHFIRLRKDERAAKELKAATEMAPGELNVLLAATEDALRRGDTAAAKNHLAKTSEAAKNDVRVLMARGMVEFGEENPEEAISIWRKGLMTSSGTDADVTWWLAYSLISLGRVSEAKPLLSQYRRLAGPEAPLLRFLEALFDEKCGRPVSAILLIDKIKERFEPRWEGMIQLARGRCYEAVWDERKAAEAYNFAIQTEPTAVVPRLALAKLKVKRRPGDALIEVERGLALIPNDPALLIAQAGALLSLEIAKAPEKRSWADFDRAWEKAASAAPGTAALSLMWADRLDKAGKQAEAVAYLEAAAAKAPQSATIAVACADGLTRLGKPERALTTLDRATAPGAAGDQASLRISRARALSTLFRGTEARTALIKDIDKLAVAERPQVQVALGQFEMARGDTDAARRAYLEWSRLLPDDPRPQLVLLEMALRQTDATAIQLRVEELRKLGGDTDVAYRLGRAKAMIWEYDASGATEGTRADPLQEATALVVTGLVDAPELPAAQMTRAEVLERKGRLDEAIAAYERSWENGVEAALPRIINLLARRQRFDALAKLRNSPAAAGEGARLDLLSAQAFMRVGDRTHAARIAEQVAHDMPDSAQALAWQVRVLDHLGRIDDAESALLAMAERRPSDLQPWLTLLQFQAERKRTASAAVTINRIRSSVKTDKPELLEARIARTTGDVAAADRAFRAAIARAERDVPLLIEAAAFYERAGQSVEAETLYRKVLELDPKNRPAARQLAVVLSARGDSESWAQARQILGPAEVANEPEDRLARAMVLTRSANPADTNQAIQALEALLSDLPAKHPTAAVAREVFVDVLVKAGRVERASQVASVSAIEGNDAGAIALYAKTLIQNKNPAAAEWQLDRLAALKPGDPREAGLRAKLIWDRSRPLEAATALERAYTIREDAPGAETLGREAFMILIGMGSDSRDVAKRLARRLARRDPTRSWMLAKVIAREGLNDEALALLRTGIRPGALAEDLRETGRVAMEVAVASDDPETLREAGEILTAALRVEPTSDELQVMTAMLRHLQRDYAEEARLYKSVLTRRPENYVVLMNLAWALSEGLHTPQEAVSYLETLRKIAPGDISARDTQAVVLLRLGKTDEAIDELEKVVSLKPIAVHHFHLARAYKRAGKTEAAKKSFEKARNAGLTMREVDIAEREDLRELNDQLLTASAAK